MICFALLGHRTRRSDVALHNKSSPRVNPDALSNPLTLNFARSRESSRFDRGVGLRGRGRYPLKRSRFDRGVGLRGRGRYPLKPSIFGNLLETKVG